MTEPRSRGVAAPRSRLTPLLAGTALAVFFAAVFLVLFSAAAHKELNHDEGMYVAGGTLLLRDGLLPYRDYPYFQMPYLSFAYAAIFSLGDHLLLLARAFSTLCATASAGALFFISQYLFSGRHPLLRSGAAVIAVALFVASPVTIYAGGLAWNHDLPLALSLLATAAFVAASARGPGTARLLFLSGALLGLAAGTRLSYAPMIVPFSVGALSLAGAPFPTRMAGAARFLAGFGAALLPAVALFAAAPAQFIFGNLGYHALNARYWEAQGYSRAMTLSGKLDYLRQVAAEPPTLALLLTTAALGLFAVVAAFRGAGRPGIAGFAASGLLALLAGALAPSPTWYQYFYPLVPYVALTGIASASALRGVPGTLVALALLVVPLGFSAGGAVAAYGDGRVLFTPAEWEPERVHALGVAGGNTRQGQLLVPGARTLTLAPIYPLEGGLRIYPQLATGPFAWRSAPLLARGERAQYGMVAPEDLDAFLSNELPAAILVGPEGALENPLDAYASSHAYTRLALPRDLLLFTRNAGR